MMHVINRLLDENSITFLKNMIGKKMISTRADDEKLCDTHLIVQMDLDDGSFYLTNDTDVVDYYGAPEDVTILKMNAGAYEQRTPALHYFPVGKRIYQVSLVNYHIYTFNPDVEDSDYMYSFTKGIIITFEDNSQMSFERLDNFIELIIVAEGNNLMDELEPISEYGSKDADAWETERTVEVKNMSGPYTATASQNPVLEI